MEKSKILEGNRLIAEFMGAFYSTNDQPNPYWVGVPDNGQYLDTDRLKYHSEWNWLIPVVEKINNIWSQSSVSLIGSLGHYRVQLFHHGKMSGIEPQGFGKSDSFIEATYNAVVEFICYFNNEKAKYLVT